MQKRSNAVFYLQNTVLPQTIKLKHLQKSYKSFNFKYLNPKIIDCSQIVLIDVRYYASFY